MTQALAGNKTKLAFCVGWCICLGSLLFAGCGKGKPEGFVASGKEYLAKHEYRAAVIELKNALQGTPNNPEARYLLGVALDRSGDPIAAEIELRKAAEAGYAAELVYPALGRSLLEQGQPQKVLSDLAAVSFDSPAAAAETRSTIGEAHLRLGQREDARSAFASALDAQPQNVSARLGMAKLAATKPDMKEAMRLVDEILAQSPSSVDALIFKAQLLASQNLEADAAKTYEKVLEIEPPNTAANTALVVLLVKAREFEKAKKHLAELRKLIPKSLMTVYLEALVSYSQGDLGSAKAATGEVLKAEPEHLPSLLLAGAVAHDSGAYGQAEDYLRKVLARAPKETYARRLLVSTYLRSGRSAAALAALQPLIEQFPDDPMVVGLAGEVYLASNQVSKATPYFEKLVALDPNNIAARTRLGQIYIATGDADKAIHDLEAASASSAGQYQTDLALVALYLRKKDLTKALAAVNALEKKQPDNPLTYNVRGIVELGKGDVGSARDSFARALQLQPTYLPAARNLAMLDLADNKPDRAKQRYEAILAKDPKSEEALLSLAELTQVSGAPASETGKALDRAVAARPDSLAIRVAQVNLLRQMGDRTGALAAAQQADAALPDNPQILEVLGRSQLDMGDVDRAIATYGKLAQALPQSSTPLLLQAEAYIAAKNLDGALQLLNKALELQPGLVQAQKSIAILQIKLGRYDLALVQARAIQKELPKDPLGYVLEAGVLTAQRKQGDAERLLTTTLKRTPAPSVVLELYDLQRKTGRTAEANALAERWIRENPKDVDVLQYLADNSLLNRDYKAAVPRLKTLLARQPRNAVTLNNLAWALGQLKQPEALRYAEEAYSLAPGNPTILDTFGWLLAQGGDMARGLELLKKASSLAPNAHATRLHYAQALIKSGQKDDARRELQALAGLPGTSPVKQTATELLSTLKGS